MNSKKKRTKYSPQRMYMYNIQVTSYQRTHFSNQILIYSFDRRVKNGVPSMDHRSQQLTTSILSICSCRHKREKNKTSVTTVVWDLCNHQLLAVIDLVLMPYTLIFNFNPCPMHSKNVSFELPHRVWSSSEKKKTTIFNIFNAIEYNIIHININKSIRRGMYDSRFEKHDQIALILAYFCIYFFHSIEHQACTWMIYRLFMEKGTDDHNNCGKQNYRE